MLVGAHALLANGGVMAGAGNQLTAMAAKHHAVPFVVLVGLQKLSPLFPHDPSVSFNDYKVCSSTHGGIICERSTSFVGQPAFSGASSMLCTWPDLLGMWLSLLSSLTMDGSSWLHTSAARAMQILLMQCWCNAVSGRCHGVQRRVRRAGC